MRSMASVYSEQLRLWWLTRNWQGYSGGVSKFNYAWNKFWSWILTLDFAAFQSFIPAITLLPSSIGDKYFSYFFWMTIIGGR